MTRREYIHTIDVEMLLFGLSRRNPFYFRIQMHNNPRAFMSEIIEALDIAYERDAKLILEGDTSTPMELNIERGMFLENMILKGETEPPRAVDIFDICNMQRIKLTESDMSKIVEVVDEMDSDELDDRIKRLRGLVKLLG